jgi:transcriptional antiterminator RfaH
MTDSGVHWYALHSKPRKERQVETYLQYQNIETFYPTIRVKPVNPRAAKIQSYFPGYLFVHVDLACVGLSALNWVPGAIGLVTFGGQPPAIPDHVIARLYEHVAQLEVIRQSFVDSLKPGDTVQICSGPLRGYEAMFDTRLNGNQRVQVLLKALGRTIKTTVNVKDIEKRAAGLAI